MMDSRASRAPTSPPETGASTACAPDSSARRAISTASEGSLVVMSTSNAPGRHAPSTPDGPSTTSRTSSGNPSMVNTTSAFAATSAGSSAQRAPASSRASALARVRVWTAVP